MAITRRTAHKIEPAQFVTFDDQLWPINLVLLVISGFAAGAIIAVSRFNDVPLIYNGWVRLGSLFLCVTVLMWGASRLDKGWIRRSLQFAALMSLCFHVGLMFALQSQQLAYVTVREREALPNEPEIIVTLPVYHKPRPAEEHERPVDVAAQDQTPREEEQKRTDLDESVAVARPEPLPQETPQAEPNSLRMPEIEQAVPRRAEQTSLFSRQIAQAQIQHQNAADAPMVPVEAPQPPTPDAQLRDDRRAEPVVLASANLPSDLLDAPRTVKQPQRQPTETEQPAPSESSALARSLAKPLAVNQPEVTAPASALERPLAPPQIAPEPRASVRTSAAPRMAATPLESRQPRLNPEPAVGRPLLESMASLRPSAPQAELPARALHAATMEASPVRIDNPAVVQQAGQQRPETEPQRTALAKGTAGVFGQGSEMNFDRGVMTGTKAPTPSLAGSQPRATQQSPVAGLAQSPSLPAMLPKTGAGARIPSASLVAQDVRQANAAGSDRAAAIEASASAAVERADAQAVQGAITAAAGSSPLDLGSTRIPAPIETGRLAGGGAPRVKLEAQGERPTRTPLGGTPVSALAADAIADVPEAPPGESGGAKAEPAVGDTATALARAASGGDLPAAQIESDAPSHVAARIAPGQAAVRESAQPGSVATAQSQRPTKATAAPQVSAVAELAQADDAQTGQSDRDGSPPPLSPAQTGGARVVRSENSVRVDVAAIAGPGGLGGQLTPQVGSLSRRAQPDSQLVHAGVARFLARRAGGPASIDVRAREPAPAFARRAAQRQDRDQGSDQASERTERAVELGLDFLARHQAADGRWSLHNFGSTSAEYRNESASFQSDTAATGLALLSFLGAGYDHFDDQYRHVVRAALNYLVRSQQPNGDLYVPMDRKSNENARLYSHGIAAIALCEAYGMTGDKALREPAQRAINFIIASQDRQGGGWRYTPGTDSDTSVSGWQLMALKSGELAGLNVSREAYRNAARWLDFASRSGGAEYVYDPQGRSESQRRPTRAMTAVGLLMRLYLGWNRNDPQMIAGAKHLADNPPELGSPTAPLRDTYYWYYATQVMFHMKGGYWQAWNDRLHPLLVDDQLQTGVLAGSWEPRGPVPDRWGPHGGRLYVTTLNLLSLEVYYRHLPIYESTAK